MSSCYVEFTHAGGSSLKRLDEFAKSVEDSKSLPAPQADKMLIEHFNAEQLSTFWWPSNNEAAETKKAWGEVPVFRVVAKSKPRDWDIYSLLDVIRQSEYQLLGVSPAGESRYRLEFAPAAYPFGGTDSLQRLTVAFGGHVIAVNDGTGREEAHEPERPQEQKSWWRFWR
jgi:hypothetical protein